MMKRMLTVAIMAALTATTALTGHAEDVKEVVISGNDQMQMDVKAFEVKPGQKVKVTLKHSGKLPKAAMGHNLVFLKKGTTAMQFGPSVIPNGGSAANDYIPTKNKDVIIAHTKMLGGGESDTIEFTAPAEEGAYGYVCTFPGHFALMNGVMTVKK